MDTRAEVRVESLSVAWKNSIANELEIFVIAQIDTGVRKSGGYFISIDL